MQVRKADFDWAALDRWFPQASVEALGVPGVVFTDADEARNRVRIGVEHAAAAAQVRVVLARLGVPASAVIVDVTEPIRQLATLRGAVRPVVTGVQINFPGFLCSLGFNASRSGTRGFVTASHCTSIQGGVEGTPYWQPLESVRPIQIATETVDPGYPTGGSCPAGRQCRRSDAAFAKYIDGTQNTLGRIARTSSTSPTDRTIVGGVDHHVCPVGIASPARSCPGRGREDGVPRPVTHPENLRRSGSRLAATVTSERPSAASNGGAG
jgi:hypothetical protein